MKDRDWMGPWLGALGDELRKPGCERYNLSGRFRAEISAALSCDLAKAFTSQDIRHCRLGHVEAFRNLHLGQITLV